MVGSGADLRARVNQLSIRAANTSDDSLQVYNSPGPCVRLVPRYRWLAVLADADTQFALPCLPNDRRLLVTNHRRSATEISIFNVIFSIEEAASLLPL